MRLPLVLAAVIPALLATASVAQSGVGALLAGRYGFEFTQVAPADAALRRLLGRDYAAFRRRLMVSWPNEIHDGIVVGSGCMPHACTREMAAFAFAPDGRTYAAILTGSAGLRYYGNPPPAVRDLLKLP